MYIASQKRYIEAAVDPEMLFGENGGRHRFNSESEYLAARVAYYDLEEDENMAFEQAVQRLD